MALVGVVLSLPLSFGIQSPIPFSLQFGSSVGFVGLLCWGGFIEYPSRISYIRGAVCGALVGVGTTGVWIWYFAFVLAELPLAALKQGAGLLLTTLSAVALLGAFVLGLPLVYARTNGLIVGSALAMD